MIGDLVDRKVLADGTVRSLSHEGAFGGVDFGQEGAVALGGPKGGPIGDGFMEPTSRQVYPWGGGGQPKGGHVLAMFNWQWEGREAGFDAQYGDRGGEKAVGNPSVHLPPEGVKSVLHFDEGGEEVGAVQEDWGD